MFCIYDLDGTLIDSSHRQLSRPDGSLDLDHWRENSTHEKIMRDKLLPLTSLFHKHTRNGHTMIFCTARVMRKSDHEYLLEYGLNYHYLISRPAGCSTEDGLLKEIQLRMFAHNFGITWQQFCDNAIMYEDNSKTIEHLSNNGLTVENAVRLNAVCSK